MWEIIKQNTGSLITVITVIAFCLYFGQSTESKTYNCGRAEIHPDYPVKVKQACRELMKSQYETTDIWR
jgi:hypothetical protein